MEKNETEKSKEAKAREEFENRESLKNRKLTGAFKHAASGILSATQSERNIRIQFVLITVALILGIIFKLNRVELILLVVSIFFIIFAEMINTAIEAIVDLYTTEFHPKAKIAKDVGAGAVVMASINAIIVGYFLFFEKIANFGLKYIVSWSTSNPLTYFILLIATTLILIVAFKLISKKVFNDRFIPSGQALASTSVFMAIWSQTKNEIIISSALIMVMLVCLNRISSDRRTLWEVAVGAALGILIAIVVYSVIKTIGGGL